MIKLTLDEVIEALRGRVLGEAPTGSATGVSTDSRSLHPGELFFAVAGEKFDGHAFVADALSAGAIGAVIAADMAPAVTARLNGQRGRGALIVVDDPVAALGRLAGFHRRLLPANVIAVVGSNGKTTTKAMIDHVLGGRLHGRCSPKSFNNRIGVPLTLLSAGASDEYLVVEIGTNCPGEIAELAALVEPNMAVLTSVGEEHLEGLKDLSGVAQEECAIFRFLRTGGFAAVNVDDPIVLNHLPAAGVTLATFGASPDADLRVTETAYTRPWLKFVLNGRFDFRLRMPGQHNALNAAGAITLARRLAFSMEQIAERLETFVPPPMRSEVLQIGGVTVINDSYNANPPSALAALDMLRTMDCRGRRVVVFGEMRELGARSARLHRRVAEHLAGSHVDLVFLLREAGEMMQAAFASGGLFGPSVRRCESLEECGAMLVDELQEGDVVLLKGSRAVGLERLLPALQQKFAAPVPLAT